jgi:hypothetical protein
MLTSLYLSISKPSSVSLKLWFPHSAQQAAEARDGGDESESASEPDNEWGVDLLSDSDSESAQLGSDDSEDGESVLESESDSENSPVAQERKKVPAGKVSKKNVLPPNAKRERKPPTSVKQEVQDGDNKENARGPESKAAQRARQKKDKEEEELDARMAAEEKQKKRKVLIRLIFNLNFPSDSLSIFDDCKRLQSDSTTCIITALNHFLFFAE